MRQEDHLMRSLNIDSEGNEMMLADILGTEYDLALKKLTEEEDLKNLYRALHLTPREREIITLRLVF